MDKTIWLIDGKEKLMPEAVKEQMQILLGQPFVNKIDGSTNTVSVSSMASWSLTQVPS